MATKKPKNAGGKKPGRKAGATVVSKADIIARIAGGETSWIDQKVIEGVITRKRLNDLEKAYPGLKTSLDNIRQRHSDKLNRSAEGRGRAPIKVGDRVPRKIAHIKNAESGNVSHNLSVNLNCYTWAAGEGAMAEVVYEADRVIITRK